MQHKHPNPPTVKNKHSTHRLPQIPMRHHASKLAGISITAAMEMNQKYIFDTTTYTEFVYYDNTDEEY